MKDIRSEIKEQFDLYQELIEERKTIHNKNIILEQKVNNPRWLFHECRIDHNTIDEAITFIAEQSRKDKKYGFKLRCVTLSEKPFFRFDSDGPAHKNDISGIPLSERQVLTPHFNCYNSNGQAIAYQTDVLKDEKQAKIIKEDIYFGLTHYCHVANMSLKDGSFPDISEKKLPLDFMANEKIDPFNGAEFE